MDADLSVVGEALGEHEFEGVMEQELQVEQRSGGKLDQRLLLVCLVFVLFKG